MNVEQSITWWETLLPKKDTYRPPLVFPREVNGCTFNEYKTVARTWVVQMTVNNKGQSSSDKYTNKCNQGKMNLIVKIQKHKRTHEFTIFTITLRKKILFRPRILKVQINGPTLFCGSWTTISISAPFNHTYRIAFPNENLLRRSLRFKPTILEVKHQLLTSNCNQLPYPFLRFLINKKETNFNIVKSVWLKHLDSISR